MHGVDTWMPEIFRKHTWAETFILTIIKSHSERSSSWWLPSILLIIIVLGDHCHFFCNQVGRVEANTKLPNHGYISPCLQCFHESLGTRLGNSTKVVDQVSFGHPYACIHNGQSAIMLVRNQVNFQIFPRIQLAWVSQALISYLVQSLWEKRQALKFPDYSQEYAVLLTWSRLRIKILTSDELEISSLRNISLLE